MDFKMKCDICNKNEGQIFLECMTNKGKMKINLCTQCAASRGIAAPAINPNKKNIGAIFEEVRQIKMQNDPDFKRLCPVCGKSLYQIKETGTAGCPECYETFKIEIRKAMNAHGITGNYTGSMPKRLATFRNALTDRADIQAKLEEAVKNENYEKAAVYRDFLRALERGSVTDGTDLKKGIDNE